MSLLELIARFTRPLADLEQEVQSKQPPPPSCSKYLTAGSARIPGITWSCMMA